MLNWVYSVPFWLGAIIFVVVLVGFTWVGIYVSRRYVRLIVTREPEWDKILGLVLSAYGVFYGITLALIAVSAYDNYATADSIASQEAAALGTLYRNVSGYAEPDRSVLLDQVQAYTNTVIAVEWPVQQEGDIPDEGRLQVTAIQDTLFSVAPPTRPLEILHADTLSRFGTYVDLRRQRLDVVTLGLPDALWFVVFLGAFLNAILIILFDIQLRSVHLLVSGMLCMFVALLLFTTVSLDQPFRGSLSVSAEAFTLIRDTLMRI